MQVWLHSTPTALGGWTQVDAQGRVTAVIPTGVPTGAHRLVVQDATGAVLGWTAIQIAAAPVVPAATGPGSGTMPVTGATLPVLPTALASGAAVLLGALIVLVALRRRRGRA